MASRCSLCGGDGANSRLSGLDLCAECVHQTPTGCLAEQSIEVRFTGVLGTFEAQVRVPGIPADFQLNCRREGWAHQASKLFVHELQLGDPVFDANIFIRTSDPSRAGLLLANEGLQSAVLGLLASVQPSVVAGSFVHVAGETLRVVSRPVVYHADEDLFLRMKLEVAALALHLRDFFAADAPD
jgi:hypothetical protein